MNKKLLFLLSSVGISSNAGGFQFDNSKEKQENFSLYRVVEVKPADIENHTNLACTGSCQK